jgi:hypothetical protein
MDNLAHLFDIDERSQCDPVGLIWMVEVFGLATVILAARYNSRS